MSATDSWPPAGGLTTVVVHRPAILSLHSSVTIAAPAPLILSVIRSVSNYGGWNEWVPKVHILSQPPHVDTAERDILHVGTSFVFDVIMDAKHPKRVNPTQQRVTDISTPQHPSEYVPKAVTEHSGSYYQDQTKVYRISWKTEGGPVSWGLKSERVGEIIDMGNGTCEYRTWENQGGILARVVKWMYEKTLNEKFVLWCANLKKESEKLAREGSAGQDV